MAEKTEKWKAARTKNLTAAQMKQARRVVGGKRSEAVSAREMKAAKKAVDISGTKWMKASERGGKGRGGLLVDSSGKAVTGTVTLPSGQKASYVRGKRVGVMRNVPTPRGKATGGGSGAQTSDSGARRSPNYSGKLKAMGSEGSSVSSPTRTRMPGSNAGMIPRPMGQRGAGRMSGSQAGLIDRKIGQVNRVPISDRETGGRGNKKPIMYANGTASVFDPRLGKRVTVGKSDPRHPKYKK